MPYNKGSLKGQLTTAEIRKLIRSHNVLIKKSLIKIPAGTSRDQLLKLIEKAGLSLLHSQKKLESTFDNGVYDHITLDATDEILKKPSRSDAETLELLRKKKLRDAKKLAEMEKTIKLAKKEGVKEFKQKKAEAGKTKPVQKPAPKPVEKPKKEIKKVNEKKKEEVKKILLLEDKKNRNVSQTDERKKYKINSRERLQMMLKLSESMGWKKINPHKVLGIKPSEETPELVKRKCKELRLLYHPDKNREPDAEKFDLVDKCCKILLTTIELRKDDKKEEVKKEEDKKPVRKKEVIIVFRNKDENVLVNPTNISVQSKIEQEYPGYKGYDRINLIKLQEDALNETPFKNRPKVEVLVKNNEGRDLQVRFGVEGSSKYGKSTILKKSSTEKRPVKIFLTGGDGAFDKPDGKRTKSRPALEKAWDKIGVDIEFATTSADLEAMEKRLKEQGIELYKSGN
jgi:hypothetical protein